MEDVQQLLVGGDVELLTDVLRTALAARQGEPAASRLGAAALLALAAAGNDAIVARVLGDDDAFEVRVRWGDDARVPPAVSGLSATDAVRCFAGGGRHEAGTTVELVRHGAQHAEVLLVRTADEPPQLHLDEATCRAVRSYFANTTAEPDTPVAALAEVLAHLPTREDIADAVTKALSDATVEVAVSTVAPVDPASHREPVLPLDGAAIADAVLGRLVGDRRLPRAHDVADVVAALIPTAGDIADLTAVRVNELTRPLAEHLESMAHEVATVASCLQGVEAVNADLVSQLDALRRAIVG